MNYHLVEASRNKKTGPIPVVTISRDSCPTSCPLKGAGGCYAEGGPLRIHWDKVTDGAKGTNLKGLCSQISRLPRQQLWRYGQAGDLPGVGDSIDKEGLLALARANRGRPVIAFTHKPPTEANLDALKEARGMGFHVNLSADDLHEADELAETGLNVVTVLGEGYARKKDESLKAYRARVAALPRTTPAGRKIAVCPATYTDTRCSECQMCASKNHRKAIIGFPAHGTRRKKVGERAVEGVRES